VTATNSQSPPLRRAELVQAMAFAADLAFGLELEDGLRSCYMAMRIAGALDLSHEDRVTVYYASLIKDAGCTAPTPALARFWQTDEIAGRRDLMYLESFGLRAMVSWAGKHAGSDAPLPERARTVARVLTRAGPEFDDALRTAGEVCARISARLGLPPSVQEAIGGFFEQWDGRGVPARLKGDEISLAGRVVSPTFVIAPLHRIAGRDAVVRMVRGQRGNILDPAVADATLELAKSEEFWAPLEGTEDLQQLVLDLEPESDLVWVDAGAVEDTVLAFADFVDLKSPFTAAHSRRVGRLAQAIARHLGLEPSEVTTCARGGLLHDLGLVAVPSHVLDRPDGTWRQAEREQVRLHPYMGERIIERVPLLADLKPCIAAHHERFDGTGFHRGLRGPEIPLAARIITVADRLDELTHEGPGMPAMGLEQALARLHAESGGALDPEVVAVVSEALGGAAPEPAARPWPAGLTDREVEVLKLAATGITRKAIGRRLGISENTVRHHLEHIYNKTGTSTRVGALLFAIENQVVV
jgi:HD-GYP domain-containing protein (c-di-GMP phosphodiesterase class II)